MSKVEREFANKVLVNSYGVAQRFVKTLFMARSSIIKTEKVMASNPILVKSNLVES